MKKLLIGVLVGAGIVFGWTVKDQVRGLVSKPSTIQEENKVQKNLSFGAQLSLAEGVVEVKPAGGEWKRAEVNASLKEGDSIEVLGTGRAIISLDDGSAVRLNDNSSVTLNTLTATSITITNNKGQVYTRVVKAERPFFVRARTVVYQSMGTAYKTINEDLQQGVEVYQSKVKVLGATDNEVLVETGKKYYVVNKANKKIEKIIAKIEEKEIKADKFVQWNKTQDASNSEFKDELGVLDDVKLANTNETSTDVTTDGSIVLSVVKVNGGVKLSWTVKDVKAEQGFKLVKSLNTDPVYPGSDYVYLSGNDARSYVWKLNDGKTYNFRVCEYLGDVCGTYSNNVKITVPSEETTSSGDVTAISLVSLGGNNIKWTLNGYSEQGFKVVWSKSPGPTYPTRDSDKYDYLSDPAARADFLEAFDGSGTYYVRVCEYLGGKCGKYSNQITVNLGSGESAAVSSITLRAIGGGDIAWDVSGYSEQGFKVVWSKSSGPTYPTRDTDQYQYLDDPGARNASVDAFDGGGTYYVRVCEYLGGKCGLYSNQVQVNL